jgi:methylated-DNA-[protein]-cysteine S-methyltransferase
MNRVRSFSSSWGDLWLGSDGVHLTAVSFTPLDTFSSRQENDPNCAVLIDAERQLAEYFGGWRKTFDLPLSPAGTPFQMEVWSALREIAYGQTLTYGDLAKRLGKPLAVRAVGLANGKNPLAIVIPCHRVIGANRKLTGYGGGLEWKRRLLDLEAGGALF